MKNPIKRIKAWINARIARAVRRELTTIFRKDGEVNVDVHLKSHSWAVIKVDKGDGCCYLKFLDLGKKNLKELTNFLRYFERVNIDADPYIEGSIHRFYRDLFL